MLPLCLVYRLIRTSQDATLRERADRKREESAIASCVAYVGLFLAASLFFVLVILLVYRFTLPVWQVPNAAPQESHWSMTKSRSVKGQSDRTPEPARCICPTVSLTNDRFWPRAEAASSPHAYPLRNRTANPVLPRTEPVCATTARARKICDGIDWLVDLRGARWPLEFRPCSSGLHACRLPRHSRHRSSSRI